MRHYATDAYELVINKDGNEYYHQQIYLISSLNESLSNGQMSEEEYVYHIGVIRRRVGTKNVIGIANTEMENIFKIIEFDLVSDGETIHKPVFDELAKNYYIESEM